MGVHDTHRGEIDPFFYAQGMTKAWYVQSYGGTWGIRSVDGDIIADDIPHGAFAEHIVRLHNAFLETLGHYQARTGTD